jgi:glycosyltransferase involved in cell wall biosynthesis
MPKVSVIVPNYNHECYIKQRIDSILNQTFQDFEVILLDDYSTDNSRDVLQLYTDHSKVTQIVFNKKNSGSTFRQWEKGVELAQGEYIWIAESDDWAEPEFLYTVTNALEKCKNAGLVFVASKYIDSKGAVFNANLTQNTGADYIYNGNQYIVERFLHGNAIGNASAAVFRKKYYEQIKDDSYKQMIFCGDWFFYVQLCEVSNIVYIQQTLNNYRVHAGNVSNGANRNGKYFTEGLEVFRYITQIPGVQISTKAFSEWAKNYVKQNRDYHFSMSLKKEIKSHFYTLSFRMRYWLFYWELRYWLKKKMK